MTPIIGISVTALGSVQFGRFIHSLPHTLQKKSRVSSSLIKRVVELVANLFESVGKGGLCLTTISLGLQMCSLPPQITVFKALKNAVLLIHKAAILSFASLGVCKMLQERIY